MKKSIIFGMAVLSSLMLASCTLNGGNDVFDNPSNIAADPVKPADNGNEGSETAADNKENTDNTGTENGSNTDDANTTDDNKETENTILPDRYGTESEILENAQVNVNLNAYDKSGNVLWTFSTGAMGIGQYDNTTDVGERDNGYYFVAEGYLYCLDKYTGKAIWESSDTVGSGCSFDFDEKGNIYICGYEGPDLVVIDPDGKTLHKYGFKDTEGILDQFYWAYNLEYDNGLVYVTYENHCVRVVADPETGEAHVEQFGGNADWSESVSDDWKMKDWTGSDGTDSTTKSDKYELKIISDYYMILKYTDSEGNVTDFDYMSIVFRPVDLYEGIKDDEYGVWCGECSKWNDINNSFAYQMTDKNTLVLIHFMSDDEGNPNGYRIVNFTK